MKLFLTMMLLLIKVAIYAQPASDSTNKQLEYFPKTKLIDSQPLLGIWESQDSSKHQIKFRFHENAFILTSVGKDSEGHLFYAYSFSLDTACMISNMGIIYKWPPDYCYINPVNNNNIEINYGLFGSPAQLVKYKKVVAKKRLYK